MLIPQHPQEGNPPVNVTTPDLDSIKRDDAGAAIPTGFAELDALLDGGTRPGQLVVLAGLSGVGVSTLALGLVRHAAIGKNLTSALISFQSTKVDTVTRMLSAEARVRMRDLRSGQLTDDDWTKLARRMGEVSESPMFVDDEGPATLGHIRAAAEHLRETFDAKLIVVDCVHQIVSENGRGEDMAEVTRELKQLAMETGTVVVAAARVAPPAEWRLDMRPTLADLGAAGSSLVDDADVVILLHRDDYFDDLSPRAGEADLIVAKQRDGVTGTATVASQLHLSRFVSMAVT
jgi:replicative DNA helicase